MRRGRTIREYRNSLLRHRVVNSKQKRQAVTEKMKATRIKKAQKLRQPSAKRVIEYPAASALDLGKFVPTDEYTYKGKRTINVCHVIESLGMGGAQTMMFELVNGLNNYFGDHVINHVVCLHYKSQSNKKFSSSYGVFPESVDHSSIVTFCDSNRIDIIIHHRTANSKCIRKHLPKRVKYIVVNHTINNLERMWEFELCDAYISVCNYLANNTRWQEFIHPSRRVTILNGVENRYLADIEAADLGGGFKTGRCHRLASGKFKSDSLRWMMRHVRRQIPDFHHYLIGHSEEAKYIAKKCKFIHYIGPVADRSKKMSIIKALDVYYYETFQHEGASIAILESLACGVPVLCKPLGGCPELVYNGTNGFLATDRSMLLLRLQQLYEHPKMLAEMKAKTLTDFQNRLHIKHVACKYMQLIESLV